MVPAVDLVQALVAQSAYEAFDEGVLRWQIHLP